VAATGVKPNIEPLQGSGVATKWGVLVDGELRTNVPDVYAAGDVAETRDRMTGERYVHAIFPNAVEQGKVVGLRLLGYDAHYEGAESMNSLKHLGLPVIAVGAQQGDEELRARHGSALRKLFLSMTHRRLPPRRKHPRRRRLPLDAETRRRDPIPQAPADPRASASPRRAA
jgi:NADPH-dependent 2,4-dienoyl-CoA reductase/sulfur reductase-like enzyme